MSLRTHALAAVALAALACAAPASLAQVAPQTTAPQSTAPALPQAVKTAAQFAGDYKAPRDSAGRPDLAGYWTNASVSRMERPANMPPILSEEQAAQLEGRALFNVRLKTEKSFVDPNAPAPEKGKALPGVGNYDVAFTDPGAAVATIKGEKRSSYITFPADGKIPAMTEEGRKMRAAATRRLFASDFSYWEIAMLVSKGRLQLGTDVGRWLDRAAQAPGNAS